jgi:hypothetical protein
MSLASTLKNAATTILSKLGTSMTFTRDTVTTTDAKNGNTTKSTTTYTALAAHTAYSDQEIDGTTIIAGDLKVFIQYNTASDVPLIDDRFTLFSKTYRIQNVEKYIVNGTLCAFKCQARA